MKNDAALRFLEQFTTSKNNIEGWPQWMQSSAKVASASFPKSQKQVPADSDKKSLPSGSLKRDK